MAEANKAKAGGPPSGFYIYLGPTIKGLIQANTIYRGDRAHALEAVAGQVRDGRRKEAAANG